MSACDAGASSDPIRRGGERSVISNRLRQRGCARTLAVTPCGHVMLCGLILVRVLTCFIRLSFRSLIPLDLKNGVFANGGSGGTCD